MAATDPIMETMIQNARQRLLDEQSRPNDELLLMMDHNSRQTREAIRASGVETRTAIKDLERKLPRSKRATTELGVASVGGVGLGASILYFLRTFFSS